MLLRKHFRRCHDACLVSVSNGDERCQYSDHGLSAAYISLQETVHLTSALHVVSDLGYHPFLGSGQREGESFIAFVECLADLRHVDALVRTASYVFLFQKRELQIEQLFEFQPVFSLLKGDHVLREMYVPQGEMQRHESALFHKVFRHGLFDIGKSFAQGSLHQLVHHLAGNASVLELFRARIYSGHGSGCFCDRSGRRRINLRVNHIDAAVESCRLAEENKLETWLEFLVHPFDALEKDQLDLSCAVADPDAHLLFLRDLDSEHFRPYLHVCHVRPQVADTYIRTSVDVPERIQPQQLADRTDRKLFLQQVSPFRTDSRKKLNVHIKPVLCHSVANLIKIPFCSYYLFIFVS